jgi:hypothetical protein
MPDNDESIQAIAETITGNIMLVNFDKSINIFLQQIRLQI